MRSKREGASLYGIRDRMAKAMWDGVGIFRDGSSMEEAEQVVDECLEAYRGAVIGDGSRRYNTAFMNYVEVGNVLQLAKTVVMAPARAPRRAGRTRGRTAHPAMTRTSSSTRS